MKLIEETTGLTKCKYCYLLTILYFNQKKYDEAEKYCLRCLKIDDEFMNANNLYSFFLHKKGKIEEACVYVRKRAERGRTS